MALSQGQLYSVLVVFGLLLNVVFQARKRATPWYKCLGLKNSRRGARIGGLTALGL